ncbi:MAG TPA: hypothetical protein VNK43_08580 [Gemmatimonadales bacterium]|nr:hypothetical protein [Gemmatimonadales bacterium]
MSEVAQWRRAVLDASGLQGEALAKLGLLVDGLIEAVRAEPRRIEGGPERPLTWDELSELKRRFDAAGGWRPDWLDEEVPGPDRSPA